jgi:dihydroneopterin triphosphate diphosphatase
MTRIEVGVVDVYLIDPQTETWRVLALRRGTGTRCPGAWEAVHGRVESEETPEDAAVREVLEETGLTIRRLYNITVHSFYLHQTARVEVAIVFCAFVDSGAVVTLGQEHVEYTWLSMEDAAARFIWPRATQALGEIRQLLGTGDAGPAEDVLRVI